jgi:hypothetical protein
VGKLSPLEFHLRTQHPRPHRSGNFDESTWLTLEPIRRVDKQGIRLLGDWYWSEDLESLTTGRSGVPRKSLYIRYDRALAARGVLQEIIVVEEDPQGRFHERCRCSIKGEALGELDRPTFLARRRDYVREMVAARGMLQHEYLRIERGTEVLEAQINDELARKRRQKNRKNPPVVASPIYGLRKDEQREDEETRRLREEAYLHFLKAQAAPPPPSVEADPNLLRPTAGAGDQTGDANRANANPSTTLLGGRSGFAADDDNDEV